jgi:phosphomannomutase
VFGDRGWAQVLPDPDEPLIHLYAEGSTQEVSEELVAEMREIVEEIEQRSPETDQGQGEAVATRT